MNFAPQHLLLGALAVLSVGFVALWFRAARASRLAARLTTQGAAAGRVVPTPYEFVVGAVTNFFDTLGIGSFATTTALFRARRTIDDAHIPGTLNVGHCLPICAQAFIYTTIIEVDMTTLVLMIAAAIAGSWLGAGVVSGWPRRNVQIGMGFALLAAATLMLMRVTKLLPPGGDATALTGGSLAIGVVANFILGALMSLGIGLYAPCMIVVGLLGMNPKLAFPIMMSSCAFLMPFAGMRFVKGGSYSLPASLGLTLGGIPAVLVAAFIVKELELDTVRWLVVAVVTYTAVTLLHAAFGKGSAPAISPEASPPQ